MRETFLCSVEGHNKYYDVKILPGALKDVQENPLVELLSPHGNAFAIITNDGLEDTVEPICQQLRQANLPVSVFSFPGGDQHKSRETKERLEDEMLKAGLGRDTCVVAVGGGVVIDLAGFLAATYCRGVPLVLIPTSLLAMVDASLGGKNGVNTPFGKNMVGTFYFPRRVIIDPRTLDSLPLEEIRNGMVETIKHALIDDADFFDFLEKNVEKILAVDPVVMEEVIPTSCWVKIRIIKEDETDMGRRNLLNFGHTVGHAIETLTNYTVSHGEAVAIGVLVESYMSKMLGHLPPQDFDRIVHIYKSYDLPLKLPKKFSTQQFLDTMHHDKKARKGVPRFVLIKNIGECLPCDGNYCMSVDPEVLEKALHWMNDDLCRH